MASSPTGRPFYSTIWFNAFTTGALVAVLVAIATAKFQLQGRPLSGVGQFGVVLIAIYWVFIFPKLRNIHSATKKDASLASNDGKTPEGQNPK